MFLSNVVVGGLPTYLRMQSTSDESPPSGVGTRSFVRAICSRLDRPRSDSPTSSSRTNASALRPPSIGSVQTCGSRPHASYPRAEGGRRQRRRDARRSGIRRSPPERSVTSAPASSRRSSSRGSGVDCASKRSLERSLQRTRGGTVSSSRAMHVRYRQIRLSLCRARLWAQA
jgi:hypothetical protein